MMSPARSSDNGELLFSPNDIARLFRLVSDIADQREIDPSEVIDRLEHGVAAEGAGRAPPAVTEGIRMGEYVERMRRLRLKRNEVIGAQLFRDPAWDILLDLFASHERGERVSVIALALASGVPQSTALRTIQRLEEKGLIVREGDPDDLRRSWVRASPEVLNGIATMAGLFAEAVLASAEPPRPAMVIPMELSDRDLDLFFSNQGDPT
jgi:DNA-binding MarR family transcriptional regulator